MEAPAGQVIQNEVGVRPLGVRIIATATLVLVRPLQLDGGQGILGYASVVGGFGPGLTEVSVPRLVATYDVVQCTHTTINMRQPYTTMGEPTSRQTERQWR